MAMTAVRIAATTDEKTATGGRTVTAATSVSMMTWPAMAPARRGTGNHWQDQV